jgi:hypothetical protein
VMPAAVSTPVPAASMSTTACKRRLRYNQHGEKGPAKSQFVQSHDRPH